MEDILINSDWSSEELLNWKFGPTSDKREKMVFQVMESITKAKRREYNKN